MIRLGLTYDDVLLVPQRSSIRSRKDVNTRTTLVPGISLAIPIVSANMDTVTESEMAIAMATLGGIGIIHRFLSIEQQVKEVKRVKRYEQYVVDDPVRVAHDLTVGKVREVMEENHVTSVLVVDTTNRLLGILTARDMMFQVDDSASVVDFMTPRKKMITALDSVGLSEAKDLLWKHKIEKLPLVDKKDHVVGLITSRDILRTMSHPQATKDKKGRLVVGAAIGVRTDAEERARELIAAGCDVLVLDIAHGHADHAIRVLKMLKKRFPGVPIIAGNVATKEGTKDLIENGADTIKVGIGPGTMCTTRVVAGAGVPQFTAVMDCVAIAKRHKIPTIADGGIKTSGDVVKAIGAGASTVMIGGMFAGTEQSPGVTVIRRGKKYKVSRGMASVGANLDRNGDQGLSEYVAEGIEAFIPYGGDVYEMVIQLIGGLRSGMSYAGAESIEEFWKRAEFIQITSAGIKESLPHDVELM